MLRSHHELTEPQALASMCVQILAQLPGFAAFIPSFLSNLEDAVTVGSIYDGRAFYGIASEPYYSFRRI